MAREECPACGHAFNPQYLSSPGCPWCHGTGTVCLKPSAADQAAARKWRVADARLRFNAKWAALGLNDPWRYFVAWRQHDARATGDWATDERVWAGSLHEKKK